MYKTLAIRIVGTAPLIMHNIQLADPLNKFARAIKEITDKKMTEADYTEKSRIEFLGSLYMGPDGPILPSYMIEGLVIAGAKKSKRGPQAKAGIVVEKHASVEYEGPRIPDDLFSEDRFRLTTMVRVGQSKVVRTRPIFQEWAANLEVDYLPDVINERDITTAIRNGGILCGFGDWKPRHGRFALAVDMQQQMAIAAE